MGIDSLKVMYVDDDDFKEIYKVCFDFANTYHFEYSKFFVQDGLLFKASELCILKCSMRDNIIKEKNSESMSGHFGLDKTLE